MEKKQIKKELSNDFYYDGIAKLKESKRFGEKVFTFVLYGKNGEALMNRSHPYNTAQARLKTLRKYFSNFKIVE